MYLSYIINSNYVSYVSIYIYAIVTSVFNVQPSLLDETLSSGTTTLLCTGSAYGSSTVKRYWAIQQMRV